MITSYNERVDNKTVNEVVESGSTILDTYFPNFKMRIFDSMARSKVDFKSINDLEVLMYTCGPTVYNYAHIGNLRSYIFPDIMKRLLRYSGYEVRQIMNFTDVGHLTDDGDHGEDKMKTAMNREKKSALEIASTYEKTFIDDLDALHITQPSSYVKATDAIKEQIDMILQLQEKGYTYRIEGDGIYVDTSKIADYGKLVGRKHIAGLQGAKRVGDVGKKNITDFALWKINTTDGDRYDDMEWDSPWGRGFPGWHIECSAIATYGLGTTIDIHTGGIDHKPIHHTNEIAQSECCNEEKFSNYWMHGEFLNLQGDKKMSKSSGNFLHLQKLKEAGIDPIAYKFYTYQTHYRKGMKFTLEGAEKAEVSYNNLKRKITDRISANEGNNERSSELKGEYYKTIFSALFDDINMPMALAEINKVLSNKEIYGTDVLFLIQEFDKIAGLNLLENTSEEDDGDIPKNVKAFAEQRMQAKREKERERADTLRATIAELGYKIIDTSTGYELKKKP